MSVSRDTELKFVSLKLESTYEEQMARHSEAGLHPGARSAQPGHGSLQLTFTIWRNVVAPFAFILTLAAI